MNTLAILGRAPTVLLCVVVALLAGCGFHFAGDRPLPEPLKSVYIEVIDPYHVTEPPLQESLQARIVRRGGVIKSKAADAQSELRLFDLKEGQEVLSFGPDGKAIEYRLISRISYELRAADGTVLVSPETQAVTRDYSFNAQQILSKEAEANRLRIYIQDQLAELLLLRIEAQLRAFTPVIPLTPAPAAIPELPASAATPEVSVIPAIAPMTAPTQADQPPSQ
jgi:LPS-assembly lipoprotein